MSRTIVLLARLDREIEHFYLTRARAVIDARLRSSRSLARSFEKPSGDCGLHNLRTAIDRLKTGGTTVASPPKPNLAALMALPGIVHAATIEANTDAEKEAARFAAVIERKNAAMTRIRGHRTNMESGLGAIEKFADDVDAALGGNGGPKDDPTTEGSPPPSDPSPPSPEPGAETVDTRALGFSSLHPSLRSQMAEKVVG